MSKVETLRRAGTSGAILLALSWSAPLGAWGSEGHRYVGSLAFALLNPNSRSHVRALLGPGVSLGQAAIAAACHIAPLPNPTADPPEQWAAESVVAAQTAYAGMSFSKDAQQPKDWDVHFDDASAYGKMRSSTQKQRLIAAGARLAEVLNSIWPSTKVSAACKAALH